ncbi:MULTISPECIES: hypothetical protein [unclassified Sulfitobacter]|jgi:hypothetical protein|uniref:hypothetical protein n=1 Tax=unclassified Sulfitobacter TaxID=196795 RepID=UPI000B0A0823|nr:MULTISPECIES: hypothetical protein [unclassified Sulfitobacter]
MKIAVAALVPLAIAACSPLEPLPLGVETSSPVLATSHLQSGPSVEYQGYRVVQPDDWRSLNDTQKGH